VYFELVAQGHSQIAALDPSSGSVRMIRDSAMEPAVSPDGSRLAYISQGSLFAGETLVAREAADPAFFPDGQRVAFAQGFPGRRSIGAVSVSGGTPVTLIQGGDNFEPAVSSDGKLLAYVHQSVGSQQVWIRNLESGDSRMLTSGACNNSHPAWELDAPSIVFASDCSRGYGLPALYRVRFAP
jgi:TolB protein